VSSSDATPSIHGKLGDLLPIKYGKSLPDRLRDPNGTVPVFGSSGRVGVHTEALTQGPALIVGRKGSVGSVYFSEVPCWPIDTVYFTEAAAGKNLRYFKYLLDSLRLVQLDKSTAVPGLSRDDYNAVTVVIAPPQQQAEVVAEIEKQFSRLDEAIANLRRVKANTRRYARAVLNAAADGTLWPLEADRGAHEGFSASHWLHATLGDVATVLDPNPSHRMPAYVAQGIPLISSENFVGEEGIDFDKGKQVGADTLARQRALFAIEEGDFVLSRIGTIGKTRLLPLGRDYCLSHALVVIKVRAPHVDKHWLRYAISSDRVLHQAHSGVQSVGVPDLGMGKMRAFEIRIPPLTEQHRIVAEVDRRLSIVREVEAEVDANVKRAHALRQAILAKAFGASTARTATAAT
jgi:type I restriction enzyme S subunit